MIKITRWRPATCACVIDYQWDTREPEDARVHTQVAVTPCAEHATDDRSTLYARVSEEHHRISRMLERVEAVNPARGQEFLDRLRFSGRGTDGRRVLVAALPNLTALQRAAIQVWATSRYGSGYVTVTE